jgi:hypothetical protein
MMLLFDGPAEGSYMVGRAPLYLRAVVAADGTKDVLDQLGDTPRPGETVHVYRRVTAVSMVHLNRGRHGSGFYASASYRHLPAVDGEAFRSNAAWVVWCHEQPEAAQ